MATDTLVIDPVLSYSTYLAGAILDSHAKGDDQEILAALSIVRNFLQFADDNSTATMVPNQQDDPSVAPWFAPRLFSPP